jgi:hypothetical protein
MPANMPISPILLPTREKRRLAVCWIWGSPSVFTESVESMLQLRRPDGWEVQFFRGKGWGPAKRHINACEAALAWGADYILILGADQLYDDDLLLRLTSRIDEGYETMTALVPARGYVSDQNMRPFQPVASRFRRSSGGADVAKARQFRGRKVDGDMVEIITHDPANPVQQINFIGSGVMMFHRDHLLALDRPWFSEMIDWESQQRVASMDVRFAWDLQMKAGARLWVDTTIKVRHLHIFKIDETYQDRFADWEKPGAGDPSICMYKGIVPESTDQS